MAKQTKKFEPTVWSTKFVCRSAIFEGLQDLWDKFVASECDFTWGDDNIDHTLVKPQVLMDQLDQKVDGCPDIEIVRERIVALADNFYIDMEH